MSFSQSKIYYILAILYCNATFLSVPAFALETPQVKDFPEWSDKFATCAGLYHALGKQVKDPSGAAAQSYKYLEKEAILAAYTYAKHAQVGIDDSHVEDLFQNSARKYEESAVNLTEGGTEVIRPAVAHCKNLLPIQQALQKQKAQRRIITIKRE